MRNMVNESYRGYSTIQCHEGHKRMGKTRQERPTIGLELGILDQCLNVPLYGLGTTTFIPIANNYVAF